MALRFSRPVKVVSPVETSEKVVSPSVDSTKRVLITSGGTREAIDGVRAITNTSSGRTGAVLAEDLVAQGYDVVYLHAESAVRPTTNSPRLRLRSFTDFRSLDQSMTEELGRHRFDVVLHAAAVSDFSVASVETPTAMMAAPLTSKIDSNESLAIHLKQNPKIVDKIKSLSKNPDVRVVAFKLTNTPDESARERAIETLASRSRVDLIVHNDLNEISASTHPFTLWQNGRPIARYEGARDLGQRLAAFIGGLT
jgi:phosphopantothenate--cysteine ligase